MRPDFFHTIHFLQLPRNLVVGLIFLFALPALAQKKDTSSYFPSSKDHSPLTASILSAVLPGTGQIYNKKYWKPPIIYGGFIALGYYTKFNHDNYIKYRNAYKFRTDNNPTTNDNFVNYTEDNLLTLKNTYQRYRDIGIISMSLLYILNVVDASVDAHLFTFDVGKDLTINIHPSLFSTAYNSTYNTGISLIVSSKK